MKSPSGVWGLESRARCAGFSVTEIGNRKERVRDYASFPDRQPHRTPMRIIQKNGSQGAKRPLTLNKPVLSAFAKSPPLNRREAEKGV